LDSESAVKDLVRVVYEMRKSLLIGHKVVADSIHRLLLSESVRHNKQFNSDAQQGFDLKQS
jgi:predicted metallo-beta-lactamase superfamily hydrolase